MDEPDCIRISDVPTTQKPFEFRSKNGIHRPNSAILVAESKSNMVSASILVEQATQTPKKLALENVQQTAKDLAKDVIYYVCREKTLKPINRHAVTLRRTVDEVSQKHEIVFKSIVQKLLPLTTETLSETFLNVVEAMFSDSNYNWGRVVSVYAFGATLAKHFADNNINRELIDKIVDYLGVYVAKKMGKWILQQGGWDAFDSYFPEKASMENTLWRGLLYTFVGLGALATMVAAK